MPLIFARRNSTPSSKPISNITSSVMIFLTSPWRINQSCSWASKVHSSSPDGLTSVLQLIKCRSPGRDCEDSTEGIHLAARTCPAPHYGLWPGQCVSHTCTWNTWRKVWGHCSNKTIGPRWSRPWLSPQHTKLPCSFKCSAWPEQQCNPSASPQNAKPTRGSTL